MNVAKYYIEVFVLLTTAFMGVTAFANFAEQVKRENAFGIIMNLFASIALSAAAITMLRFFHLFR